ncbi:uncharacterized protein CC84DRAFT_1117246 [Paraphaeosphaeria sporulosa]|uniref:Zn(2)-C6 fungal-type domain-containing protein n=1 Tax=Paraphaeosphaeria sporulosa TaxID=1460663 RepID=A0A177CHX2_9PLEO|nr:uncharacterized protein CC84DRAFT_1117246 [Paraphaeosphaeria sporulosa]OAG07134.1 hypothetical protein CC84DRAFT_1117246 [Paraphaeosphaeria sporulosa]
MSPTDSAAPESAGESSGRPAKRHRIPVACTWCRQRKSRCDGTRPKCSTCRDHGYECEYSDAANLTRVSASKELSAIESRLAILERSVAGLDGRVSCVEALSDGVPDSLALPHRSAEPSNAGGEDVNLEARDPTDGIGSMVFTKEEEAGFFGPSSNIAFTRIIVRSTTSILKATMTAESPLSPEDAALRSHMLHVSRQHSPARDQFSPANNLPVTFDPFSLPPESETKSLIEIYFETTGVLFPYVDKPSFVQTYQQLNAANIRAARRSWLGLLNMVLAMATSASHGRILSASERATNSDVFYRRALALCEKNIRHGTSLEMVQMFLLMSQYLQGTERSIETWNIHGLAVKAAYQLGLHSPHALKRYPPLEQEIRKRTWYGCVILDRTLSMTLGRPSSIPQNFVRLDLPSPQPLEVNPNDSETGKDKASVEFYSATILLYAITGEIVDVLYDNNLGCETAENVFDIASQVLQFEQKFLTWQHSLPATLALVDPDFLTLENSDPDTLRYRFVLTVRFLNARILAHRPVLCRYLEFFSSSKSDDHQLAVLMQIGGSSLRICVQSALKMIALMRAVLSPVEPPRHLLGAWWFSLYYTFNAALVVYSTLLVRHQSQSLHHVSILDGVDLTANSLHQSIECLSLLFKGNRMTEKCTRYTSSLAQLYYNICQSCYGQPTDTAGNLQSDALRNIQIPGTLEGSYHQDLFDFPDLNDIHMGMSLDNIFVTGFDTERHSI